MADSNRIWIVAHDFSPNADAAARIAADDLLHGDFGATIVLVHVYQVMPLPTGFDGATGLITSNLLLSATGDLTENQLAVVFTLAENRTPSGG